MKHDIALIIFKASMRAQFLLVPIALIASQPVLAQSFIGVEQSQQRLFPGATFTKNFIALSDEQYQAIREKSQSGNYAHEVKLWTVSTGGWYILDQVVGKDDYITYALALDRNGTIQGIEILQCQAHYDISNRTWLKQFQGKTHDNPNFSSEIQSLSGVSLSASAVKQGVKRLFTTYELVLAGQDR